MPSRVFVFSIFLLTLFMSFFSSFNIYYYNKLRTAQPSQLVITYAEATTMFVLNIIILVLSLIGVIWSVYEFFIDFRTTKAYVDRAKQAVSDYTDSLSDRLSTRRRKFGDYFTNDIGTFSDSA